jgi:putative nucleotidyltransferase with HDIG domain
MVTRQEAWELLTAHNKDAMHIKHAIAVEAAMRAYARKYGEDEELWGVVGLIHDVDFEEHPTLGPGEHPFAGAQMLEDMGWPAEIVKAVRSHATYSGVSRDTPMEKALFAVDELTGLVSAVALVRPSKNIADVEVKSVRKKWKDKAFARAVNREEIEQGAAELGVDLDEHIAVVIEALKAVAADLEIDGSLARP